MSTEPLCPPRSPRPRGRAETGANRWIAPAAAALLVLAAACAKRYWVPDAGQIGQAEALAKLYALQVLSDQAGTPGTMDLGDPLGPQPLEYPIAFTFGHTPYSRYRKKFFGDLREGTRRIHVLYFNPARIPDWERDDATGEFPAHFSIIVDLDRLRVAGSHPPQRPGPAPAP